MKGGGVGGPWAVSAENGREGKAGMVFVSILNTD